MERDLWVIEENGELFGHKFKGVYRMYFRSKDGRRFGMGLGFDRMLSKEEFEELARNPYAMFWGGEEN